MTYQLVRPSIEKIIDYCWNLNANEKLEVYEFGINNDLVLHIYKDEDYNKFISEDEFNLVVIHTAQNGKYVDDTGDVYVDHTLERELNRINNYKNLQTL